MKKYMQRNMGFVNNFAQQHCSREQVTSWLDKKKPVGNKPPASVYLKYQSVDYLYEYDKKKPAGNKPP